MLINIFSLCIVYGKWFFASLRDDLKWKLVIYILFSFFVTLELRMCSMCMLFKLTLVENSTINILCCIIILYHRISRHSTF